MRRSTLFRRLVIGSIAIGSTLVSSPANPLEAAGGYWVPKTAASTNRWQSVAYGNSLFVAVSDNGTERVMTSTDGITWTGRAGASPDRDWKSVAFGNNTFVAVGYSGVMTSADGITWTARTAPSKQWGEVRFLNNLFVALSWDAQSDNKPIMTSPDGITWTERTLVVSGSVNWVLSNGAGLAYGNNKYVALASSSAWSRLATSSDGLTWTARNTSTSTLLNSTWADVTFGNGVFIAVGINKVATSTDGENWTEVTGDVAQQSYSSIIYADGKFVAVTGSSTGKIATSTDGTTWTITDVDWAPGVSWSSITFGNGAFVGVANSGRGADKQVLFSDSDRAPAPTVTSISPTSGQANRQIPITITGTDFRDGATVTVGGKACTNVIFMSSTSLSCSVPTGTAGAADVVVTNSDGQSATLTGGFTYTSTGGTTQTTAGSTSSSTTTAAPSTSAAVTTTIAPSTGSGPSAAAYENAAPGVTKTDTKVYSMPPAKVAADSAITVLSPAQNKVMDVETTTPSICVPNDDELVFLDEGRCVSNVVNSRTRQVLRTLRTTVVGDDIADIRVGNAILTLAPIYFDFVSSELNQRALARVKTIAPRASSAGSVLVIGHSGTLNGNSPANIRLSQERAANTVAALKRAGATGPFVTTGVGATNPASSDKTAAAQQRNRRVVVVLIP